MSRIELTQYELHRISLAGVVGEKVADVFLYKTDLNLGKLTIHNQDRDIIGEGIVLKKHDDYFCIKCNLRCVQNKLCQACPMRYALKKH